MKKPLRADTSLSQRTRSVQAAPFAFDPTSHTYTIKGQPVPSVTQVINEVIGLKFRAGEWYLVRGQAIHACADLLARGVKFEADARIAGYVDAARKFLAQHVERVVETEKQVYSPLYQYAGTLDLLAVSGGKQVIYDYKASMDDDVIGLQLGGYSLAMRSEKYQPRFGQGVELHNDGTFRLSKLIDLSLWRAKFAACRTVYGLRKEFGLLPVQAEETGKESVCLWK